MSKTRVLISRRRFLNATAGISLAGAADVLADEPDDERQMRAARIEGNAKIQEARSVALDLLKPSKKELEHGLELHHESIVCEAYGFSPRSALDGDAIRRAIGAGASDVEIGDLREEMTMTRCVTDFAEQQEYKMAWQAAGVTCIFQNAGEESQDPLRLVKRLARFTYVTDMMRDFVTKGVSPDDVVAAKEQGKHCLVFSGNGVPLTQDWISAHDELRYVRIFYQLGIRMMHVTYNRRNMLGDGCAESANGGLSGFGRDAISEMNRLGIIVDVAHSGWQTSLESAKVSTKPMVASHTTCTALHNHIRSKPDKVIRAIADTGGFVGICCIPTFLGGKGDVRAMLDHIDHVAKRFGSDHVAIGTDIVYSSRNAAGQKIPPERKGRKRFAYYWPSVTFRKTPEQTKSMAWTNWPLFTVGLVQRGYRDEDIQKIIGGNVLRVARTNFNG